MDCSEKDMVMSVAFSEEAKESVRWQSTGGSDLKRRQTSQRLSLKSHFRRGTLNQAFVGHTDGTAQHSGIFIAGQPEGNTQDAIELIISERYDVRSNYRGDDHWAVRIVTWRPFELITLLAITLNFLLVWAEVDLDRHSSTWVLELANN